MERSAIRDQIIRLHTAPGFRFAPSGLRIWAAREACPAQLLTANFPLLPVTNHIAHEIEHAVGLRRPIRRTAEPDDDEPFGGHDDHILPDRAFGEISVARPAVFGAVAGTKAVAEIGPEARALPDPGVRRWRRRIFHPAFGEDAFAAGDTVIEIELAEARPVARTRQHLAGCFRIPRRIELDGNVAHAERIKQFLPRKAHHFGRTAA